MLMFQGNIEVRRQAIGRVIDSIDSAASLPGQVFVGDWGAFMFFESDRLFSPSFAVVASDLLRAERTDVFCLLNFDEMSKVEDELAAAVFIDAETEPHAYDAMLREGGAAEGWLFGMDRYGGASSQGGWCIYCEKGNDIAVIAMRQPGDVKKYAECLRHLHAERITTLLNAGEAASFPFNQLVEPWRRSLSWNYP